MHSIKRDCSLLDYLAKLCVMTLFTATITFLFNLTPYCDSLTCGHWAAVY